MSNSNNKTSVPEAKEAMNRFKMEAKPNGDADGKTVNIPLLPPDAMWRRRSETAAF